MRALKFFCPLLVMACFPLSMTYAQSPKWTFSGSFYFESYIPCAGETVSGILYSDYFGVKNKVHLVNQGTLTGAASGKEYRFKEIGNEVWHPWYEFPMEIYAYSGNVHVHLNGEMVFILKVIRHYTGTNEGELKVWHEYVYNKCN